MDRKNVEDIYRLSPVQQGILYHALYDPHGVAYFEQFRVEIPGRLDPELLAEMWRRAVARQGALRTSFVWKGLEEPVQVVHKAVELPVAVHDLRGGSEDEIQARAAEILAEDRRRGFDLSKAPLLRLNLLQLEEERWLVALSYHHIIMDGWSYGVVAGELEAIRQGIVRGQEPQLPPVRPFREYVGWLRRQDPAAARDYWRRSLEGFEAPTPLTWEPIRGHASRQEDYGEAHRSLDRETSSRLQETARRLKVTANTLLQGAWSHVLSRVAGRDDVTFGTTVSGRPPSLPGVERMVGCFINSLPVRTVLPDAGEPLGDWLRALQDSQKEMRRYEHTPLPEVRQAAGIAGDVDLFHSIVVFENFDADLFEGSSVRRFQRTNFPLTVVVEPRSELSVLFTYDRLHLSDTVVDGLLDHYLATLAALAHGAETLADLPPVPPRDAGLLDGGDLPALVAVPKVAASSDDSLADRFLAAVAKHGTATAVEGETLAGDEVVWSYDELAEITRRAARRLAAAGVGPETLVGLAAPRTVELVAAILSIVRAGGAYLPLDPSAPAERLAFMVEDSGAPVVVATPETRDALAASGSDLSAVTLLDLDDLLDREADLPEADPVAAGADALAYVIYTSGSTGRPKGTLIPHRQVVRLLDATEPWFGFGPDDVWTLFHSYAFDFSVWELWGPLATGGRLVVVPYWVSREPARFRQLLAERGVTVLNQTPSAFRQLAAVDGSLGTRSAPDEAATLALRAVVFGGEALEPTSLAGWVERHGIDTPRLINMYGITETTVHVTYHQVTGDEVAGRGSSSPVGVAIPDLTIDLTDRDGLAVPLGVPGEIRVGGAGLARGYLGRPGLTAERFVPAPEGSGARQYRSGDLARRLLTGDGAGSLEFLGRIDHQVKIRGFRIELGEIEAVIAASPEVAQAAVLVREDRPGDRRLVAYLVAAGDGSPEAVDTEALKERCRAKLPDYMVPAAFVVLAQLPLTVNGKLDRKALPAPEELESAAQASGRDAQGAADAGEAPSGPVEEMLAGIWCEVLGISTPGRRDDFFDLGGHSLLATRLATKIRTAFRVEVALRELFEAPQLAQMARTIEAAGAGGGDSAPPLVGLPRDDVRGELRFPVSFSQERLLFIERLETGGALYNLPSALDLHGPLDAGALAASLTALGRRHETLRTTFDPGAASGPEQVVAPEPALDLPVVDLSALPDERRQAEGARLTATHVRRPFDLERGPLARFQLLRLTPEHHALVTVFHHIVSDGWSLEVANRELLAGYGARLEGRRPQLAPLPVQYGDFAAWQRDWLEGEVLERQIDWWREHLAGAPAVLDLPFDRPRPPVQGFDGTTFNWQLPEETADGLRRFARAQGATVFMVLLGLYGWFLGRRAGVDDVTVGTPVAGRTRAETEGLIGFFVNTLVLRTSAGGDPSVAELTTRARDTTLGAHAHQDVPFEKLVEELKPPRSLAHSPLFQVMLALQAAGAGGGPDVSLPGGLTVGGRPHGAGVSKFELTLNVFDPGTGPLPGHWVYRTALWDRATIERLGRSFAALVESAVADPKRRAADLPQLTADERREVLVGWNRPPVDYPVPAMTPALVARVAEREPSRVAVRFEGESLTYGELAERAHRLAARLVADGVGPEVVVGVAAERSFELVVALLAVLEAGGAYLPLDPQLPDERLELMVDDARVPLLLAGSDHVERLAELSGDARIVALEPLVDGLGADEVPPPLPPVLPEATAYVIYTSGSTGRPKGVAVSHGALAGRLAYGLAGDLHRQARFLHKTTISFDVSILELFGPLVVGAVTVLAKPGGARDTAYLTRLIADERVTHTSFPPTLLYALLEEPEFQALDSLEVVITGGETVPAELPDRFHRRLARSQDGAEARPVELRNRYGPTETSISVTSWTARPGVTERVLPIGRPTARAQLFVLDPDARPVPVGATGEVVVGGPVVARGYLGRPRETAAAFVPHPIPELAGAGERVYRTGDLARWRVVAGDDPAVGEGETAGALEFVGRIDQQVKIRGFRIELGEIETRLARLPGVREAAVETWGEGAGRYLAAYLVPENGHLDPADLAAQLSETLPGYMVPGAFVTLDALPLGPTGKVDRGALPEPAERGVGRAEFEAPRGRVEETVARVWADLLGAERVGRADDFFDLGGHSLLATRLTGRLQESLGVEVPLRTLFESPTLADYAVAIAERMAAAADDGEDGEGAGERGQRGPIPALPRAADGTDAFPLSFAQERLWFLDRLEPGGSTYNVTGAVRLEGDLVLPAVAGSLDRLVVRHEGLRSVFAAGSSGSPVQRVAPAAGASMPLGVVDLSALPEVRAEAEADRVRARGADTPFFLEVGPLARARLLRLGDRDHVLALELHHIVSDAWSMGILVAEFAALYRAAVTDGADGALAPLPVQYADFAAWQRRHLGPGALDGQIAWWRETLAGAPPVTPLPTDRPRGTSASARGATLPLALSADVGRAVARHARTHGASPFMVVMAAFQALLARLSGEDDLVVGTTMAHRPRPELEGLVGFFINTLPIRVQAADESSFDQLTDAVRDAVFAAEEHQDLPFERLVAELDLPRDRSHSPIFQVLLQMVGGAAAVGSPGAAPETLPGLVAERLGDTSQSAKFDLILNLAARGDGLAGQWRYRTDLFEESTVERFSGALARLLEGALTAPGTPVAALPLLSAAEHRELVEERRPVPVPAADRGGETLVERLDAVFAAHPDRPAVSFPATGDGDDGAAVTWTYRELDQRTARLARHLNGLGAGPDVPVGLFLERTPRLVEAVVGTVRAGAAYVPVDPAYPAERIAFTLADAGVAVVVTDRVSTGALPELPAGVETVVLDHLPEVPGTSEGPSEGLENTGIPEVSGTSGGILEPGRDHLAYVIYTSGSTGRPKGVEVTHGNAVRLLDATDDWFSFGPDDVWTLFHSYAFDFSVWELWGALATGGRLVVVPREISRDPAAFRTLLADEGVTVLNQTPSAFGQLVAADRTAAEPLTALREVIFGGEALAPGSLAPWVERYGLDAPRLVNMYGITETTVHVTYRPVTARDVAEGSVSPIGRAIPDLGLYVADRHLRAVPRGVVGELVVAGAGLARGYLGRPALTAERFVPDPFSDLPGARLYRSGDRARTLPGGDHEYLGRIDHQVKVRGFRIELGEIEAALERIDGVERAVVMALPSSTGGTGGRGETRLVAYLVPREGAEVPTTTEIRRAAAESLPDYMVPSVVVPLDAVPLTSSGKVDRRALPDPDEAGRAELGTERVAPRDPVEELVASLWAEVLDAGEPGVHDDFFDAGGSSLAGAVLINRLQEALGEILQVVVIFDHPTVEGLAEYLRQEHPEAVARKLGVGADGDLATLDAPEVTDADVATLASLVDPLPPLAGRDDLPVNPPAVFVLAPPRSGTTLLRVMLGGHPELFAPPELELLSFNSLGERRDAFAGRDAFWLEGLVRAVMEALDVDATEAAARIAEMEAEDLPVRAAYGRLQEWLGGRMLVDKTPSYALDPSILRRAEEDFRGARYVHLVRHPYGMIRSFEEAKLDQIFFRKAHGFDRRRLAELIWTVSHANILEFLETVPEERRVTVRFADMVTDPEGEMRRVAAALGVGYDPAMARPYEERPDQIGQRMTDGPHRESRMLGDVKFHQHSGIDPEVATRWRRSYHRDFLGDPTWEMAERLGIGRETGAEGPAAVAGRALPPLEPGGWSPGEPLPLSVAQERLWFLDQLDPGSSTYNVPTRMAFRGPLDLAAVGRALLGLVGRQAGLRTRFADLGGRSAQIVEETVAVDLPVVDLSALPAESRRAESRRVVSVEGRRPFDLSRAPLLRALAVRREPGDHVLALTVHHIVADGWSLNLLMGELAGLYAREVDPQRPPLPDLPLQYVDFALWQRRWVTEDVLDAQLDYWRRQLAGVPVLDLPKDRPRPAVQTFAGSTVPFRLSAEVAGRLERLGRRRSATDFVAVLAAFAAFLSRWAGADDVAVGSPFANRNRTEVESLVGFFVSTLVLRTELSGEPSFEQLLERARRVVAGAFAHQDVPFERLVQEVAEERSLSVPPLFQVMLTTQGGFEGVGAGSGDGGSGAGTLSLGDLTIAPAEAETTVSKFDLTLALGSAPDGGRVGRWVYNRDLFDRSTIERLDRAFGRFVDALVEAPGRPIVEHSLLGPDERRALLVDWNRPAEDYPVDAMAPEMIEAVAAEAPERVAVRFEGESVSYGELTRRARRLAVRLAAAGVGPETVVGVAAERSPALVVALLGVLRAGAAYLPLDPHLPAERLGLMVADAAVPLVLAGAGHVETFETLVGSAGDARVLDLDALVTELAGADTPAGEPSLAPVQPEATAYVIYTSGSTGRPKGVAVSHRALAGRLGYVRAGDLHRDARFLQKTTISFDVSILEIFGPLVVGATTVLARPGGEKDTDYLTRLIAEERITHTSFPPTLLYALLDEERFLALDSLEVVITGGETVPAELPERFYSRLGRLGSADPDAVDPDVVDPDVVRVVLLNRYGPTETSISVTSWPARPGVRERVLPIGRPTARAEIYVLDRHLRPVPLGVPGEVVIGGPVVARGYLGRPRETAAVFVPHPVPEAATPGARVYRSGDLGRLRPTADGADGAVGQAEALEFVGRIDGQVKIRGFRVELGEIETALARRPEVAEVAVVDRGEGAAKSLVAYLVVSETGAALAEERLVTALELALADELPAYMVPSDFVLMDELPVAATGKVDRKSLPAPRRRRAGQTGEDGSGSSDAPRGPVEEVVAAIWRDVLKLDAVGRGDDFFDLGGHSLVATRVVSRLRRAFGVELPLRTLFEAPTVAGLALRVEAERAAGEGREPLPPVEPLGRPEPWTEPLELPVSFAQERLWFLDRLDPGRSTYNMPTSLRLVGPLDRRALASTLDRLARRHESLRTTFAEVGGAPVQRVAPPRGWPCPLVDLAGLPAARREAEAERLATAWARRPFDLETGPLARATLVRVAADDHAFLLTLHHIVTDGWSAGVLVGELTRLYGALALGGTAAAPDEALPELPVQVGDHAVWQRRHLDGEALDRELDFWRQRLAGAPPVSSLPTDRPRPPVATSRGAAETAVLPRELADGIDALARSRGATPFMVMVAALGALHGRLGGVDDVVLGTPVAGRRSVELEGVVGLFLNSLALRVELADEPTFGDLLDQVRETTLGAYAHQEVPFERLVEELAPERSLAHGPVFQHMVVFQNAPRDSEPLADLEVRRQAADPGVAQYDTTLHLTPTPAGLVGRMTYSRDLFDGATVRRLLERLELLLAAAVADPELPVATLPVIPAAEAVQIAAWEDGSRAWPEIAAALEPLDAGETIHGLIARRAASDPEAIAVLGVADPDGADGLTYGELLDRADELARRLVALGVGPESRVALAAGRSPALVVGLLGILRAGAAYVPLDPAYPRERLAFMMDDSAVAAVVATPELASTLPVPDGVATVELTMQVTESGPRGAAAAAALPAVDPDALAYVIYTSGSTGRPKGVLVTHRGAVHYLRWAARAYGAGGGVAPVHSSVAFDLTVTSLLAPLAAGGRLLMVPEDDGVEGLAAAFDGAGGRPRPGLVKITPAHLEVLSHLLDEAALERGAGSLVIGGEALHAEAVAGWRRTPAGSPETATRLFNEYGPTETVVGATVHQVAPEDPATGQVSIGRPLAGVVARVVDRNLRPSAAGSVGELVLGGAQMARGYRGRPALTAERFVPDPAPGDGPGAAGARVYRTGDLVRWRRSGDADGDGASLEFLGRLDHQVKLRGFRIEPGEIEAALVDLAEIREAVVTVDAVGERLVAYVVGDGDGDGDATEAPDPAAVRAALGRRLPEHMVPAVIVPLSELPLTTSGKVDRRALSALPMAAAEEPTAEDDLPRGPVEEVVATIWCDVLGLERVGRSADFFHLGGHSLLATRVLSRLREAFGVELPLRTLFERPTVARLATAVEAARAEASGARVLPPPASLGRPDPWTEPVELPLSFAQERLWFLDRLQPGTATYNMPTSLLLDGALDRLALAKALRFLARRHESLRTTFTVTSEGPVQRVAPPSPFAPLAPLVVVDLSGLADEAREAEARRLANAEAARPFDLETGPLARFQLLVLDEDRHQYLATSHHIVSDGWSAGLLVAELTRAYGAFVAGEEPDLPALAVQAGDHAAWQRRHLDGDELARQLAYWRQRLAGAPPVLELPMDRPRPPAQRFRGATERFRFRPELAQGVERLGRGHEVTLFMVMVATVATLYGRLAGTDDVVLGTPVAGRDRVEVEGIVGVFLNSLVLRVETDGEPTFSELLSRVRETTLGAYAHASVPFEKLVEELAPERSLAHAPLYQHTVVLQNTPREAKAPAGLAIRPAPAERDITRFDSSLSLAASELGLAGGMVYNRDLFDRATVRRVIDRLELLLGAVVADPDRPLAELPVVTDAERHQIAAWNDTAVDWPAAGDVTLHGLIEAQAAATPDAVAVMEDGEEGREEEGASLTYGELMERSAAVAGHLGSLGVGPETVVAIACERSVELMVGLLGILRAGAAYVPLDPSYPEDRLAFMTEDSGAPVVLAQEALVETLPVPAGVTVVALAPGGAVVGADASGRQPPLHLVPVSPTGLAYVIYTSGSTGRPKGAMNSHRGIVNRLLWMQSEYGLDGDDVVLQKTPVSFDVSVWELFWPLLTGARLVLAKPEGHKDPAYLVRAIRRHAVTTMHFVPSMLQVFLTAPGVAECATLERVIASGEALPRDLVERWYTRRPTPLHNLYGPTEAAVDVSYHATAPGEGPGPVPIGRPVANTALQVVDRHLDPAPLGSAGELLIGGVQLARGYHGRPALTAERFVPDPSSSAAGARVYRTGDLARWVEAPEGSGELEFLGRLDHQVKLRGFRIELGEIESALTALEAVREAVVVVDDSGAAGPRLVAYLVPAVGGAEELDPEPLTATLGDSLPEYMVPSVVVPLDELPLNPSGKVDRKRLPAVSGSGEPAEREYVAPRTPAEELVAGMWAAQLDLPEDRVGARDAFFEIGGNSLTGAVFVNTLQERLGEIVHVVALFDHPTVERFAAYLEREYPAALARLLGTAPAEAEGADQDTEPPVTAETLAAFRELVPERLVSDAERGAGKNRRAVFVLAPPRSGTTLLRVMLAGHPELFAPPELELLPYATLAERAEAFSGRDAYRLEGAIRALMEAADLTAEEARERIEEMTADGALSLDLYRSLQESIDGRLLVDKTPTYAWQPGALAAAEELFDEPRYIQLVRHPYGMVRSFEEARLDQIFFRHDHPFSRRRLAELLWTVSHQNVERFFRGIPEERRFRLSFEELVRQPEATMRRVAAFLDVDYDPAMIRPYESKDDAGDERMTGGLHEESRMIGDVKFHQHRTIDPTVADTWRSAYSRDFLGEETWRVAETLGVGERAEKAPVKLPPSVMALAPGEDRAPLFLVHPVSGETTLYRRLVSALGGERPVYGFESAGLADDAAPLPTVEEQAERYLASLEALHPDGPVLLAGSSMGGLVVYEMARRLEAAGREVRVAAMLDTVHPDDLAETFGADGVTENLFLRFFTGGRVAFAPAELAAIDPGSRLDFLLEQIDGALPGGLPPGLDRSRLERLLAVVDANRRAMIAYRPGTYGGSITYLRSGERAEGKLQRPDASWEPLVEGGLTVENIPGTHLSMHMPPHVVDLAAALRRAIDAEEGALVEG